MEKGKDGTGREGSRASAWLRAALRCRGRGAITDAWRHSPAASGGMGVGRAQLRTGEAQWSTVNTFDDFWLEFDQLKPQISYRNLEFDQNKSCRVKEELQLSFWPEVDLELGSRRKTRSITAKQCLTRGLG